MNTVLEVIDGYDNTEISDRIIQGAINKFADGRWAVEGALFPTEAMLIAVDTKRAAQRWQNQTPIETIVIYPGGPLVNVDDLNSKIPVAQWEPGLDGNPRPPWQLNYIVYLLSPDDGSMYTVINSTIGMRIAFERLCYRVKYMRSLRGTRVVPLVKLGSAMMRTKFGIKTAAEFVVVDWRELGAPQQVASTEIKQIGKPVAPVTTEELIDDTIPF
jgi:hypothetical protein